MYYCDNCGGRQADGNEGDDCPLGCSGNLLPGAKNYPTINEIKAAGASPHGIEVYRQGGCNPEKLLQDRPSWYLWLVANCPGGWIDVGLVDACAERSPLLALQLAAPYLSAERLDWCAERYPWAAMYHTNDRLTPARRDWCAVQDPLFALDYIAASLTPERLDWCKETLNHP